MQSINPQSEAGQKKHKKLDISRLLGNKPKLFLPIHSHNNHTTSTNNKDKLKSRSQDNSTMQKKSKSLKNIKLIKSTQGKSGNTNTTSGPQEALSSPELLQDLNQEAQILLRYSALKSLLQKLTELNAIESVGLFRESGHSTSIDLIVRYLGISSHLISLKSAHRDMKEGVHEYACALKQYLREALNPIVPFNNVPKFLQIVDNTDESDMLLQIFRITECVLELPRENQLMLRILVNFLKKMSENSENNKMTVNNLSITLGPSVLRLEKQTNYQVTGKCCEILGLMISFADDVFAEVAAENSEEFHSPRERDIQPIPNTTGKSLRHSDQSVSSILEFDDDDEDEDQEIDYLDFLRSTNKNSFV